MQVFTLSELDGNLRKQWLHLLYKVCTGCGLLPATYALQQELVCVDNAPCCGGSADVSEGRYLGRHVAIKYLRFRPKDEFSKIFKVLELQPSRCPIVDHIIRSGFAGK